MRGDMAKVRRLSLLLVAILSVQGAWAELKILDRPMWVFPGQPFRVALEQPAGAGTLQVTVPANLELYDQWDQDAIQRYYFRAREPGAVVLRFRGQGGELDLPIEVIAWGDLFQPREYEGIQLPRIWPLGQLDYSTLKSARTLHTEAEIAAMRAAGDPPGRLASQWVEMSDDEVFDIIPGPAIPRTCLIVLGDPGGAQGKGCPVCGTDIYKGRDGFYPWIFDPEKHPWKVGCPNCGTWFPSNDWHLGDMHSGPFPDDGFGCEPVQPVVAPNGIPWRWPFIAYYHQWQAYMRTLTPGITECARAFISTGDRRYAHKGLVALFRFAESHLDMSLNLNHRKLANRDGIPRWPVGAPLADRIKRLAGSFSYIQPNWDTPRMEEAARAWDLLFDQVEGDEELLEFCRRRHHPEIQTAEDFRRFVDAGVLRTCIQYGLDKAVARNWPMQEAMIATLALGLGAPETIDLADYLLNGDGALRYALTNEYFKDGAGHESPGYNGIQIRDMTDIVNTLARMKELLPEQFVPPRFVSPADDPKFRRLYDFPLEETLIGLTVPATGDTGLRAGTGPIKPQQGYPVQPAQFLDIFLRTGDPRFAQAIYGPAQTVPAQISDAEVRARIEAIGRELGGRVRLPSRFLDGYGEVILESGVGSRERAVWMRYGRTLQHAHNDMLSIGLVALQRDLLFELGYPEGWTYAGHWEANWGAHYGTHITGVPSARFGRGTLELFADSPPARVAHAVSQATSGDPPRARRERVVALVDLSDEDCYVVTLERVLGGEEHTWSFHGPSGEAEIRGVALRPQGGGTIAGPDIKYRDTAAAAAALGDAELTCLAIMPEPMRGTIAGPWEMRVPLRDQQGVLVHVTNLSPDEGELAVAQCTAPGGKSYYNAPWTIVRRRGTAPLSSQFLQVIEPIEGERIVRSVEPLQVSGGGEGPFAPLALRVHSAQFTDTIILQASGGEICSTADGLSTDGEFAFWREHEGRLQAAVLAGGTTLTRGGEGVSLNRAHYSGVIESCDWSRGVVRVRLAEDDRAIGQQVRVGADAQNGAAQVEFVGLSEGEASALVGRQVRISGPPTPPTEPGPEVSYVITAARPIPGGLELTLNLDPRIGEGPVASCSDGEVKSGVGLRMASYLYYAGKHLSNEDGSVVYRLTDVHGTSCVLDSAHGAVPAAQLEREFGDRDGDGLRRFVIYDYGPGDTITIPCWASVTARPGL